MNFQNSDFKIVGDFFCILHLDVVFAAAAELSRLADRSRSFYLDLWVT